MADYTVTIVDHTPGYVALRYDLSAVPVTITLSDLPREPMELDYMELSVTVINPSNVTWWYILFDPDTINRMMIGDQAWSPGAVSYNIIMMPGIQKHSAGAYLYYPIPRLLLAKTVTLRCSITGTYGTDFKSASLTLVCRHSSPRRVDNLITRTTYRDADGYITP